MTSAAQMVQVRADELQSYLASVFQAVGVDEADAGLVARSYVSADLYGLASHGVMRVPRIFDGIDAGTHFPDRRPRLLRENAAFAVFDGESGLGTVAGIVAMRTAIGKARAAGIGCVTVFNSNHFGTAGFYCRMAAEEQMTSMTMCNGSPGVSSPSGRRAVLGTNPIAMGAPTRGNPIILDMSISAVVRGRVLEYQRTGKSLPEGVAVDEKGNPTTDPGAALAGAFLPFGGSQAYKVFGLGLMIDILSGPLAGAAYADKVRGSANTKEDCTKGDFYLAIDVSQFRDYESYLDDVEDLVRIVKSSGDEVFMPGEIEEQRAERSNGIVTLDTDMAGQLAALGTRTGVAIPSQLTSV